MAENKTHYTEDDVLAFIDGLADSGKIRDSHRLLALMEAATGERAKMFGSSIIGFGKYAYTYASGHAGEAPLLGFSPRKAAFSLYVYTGCEEHRPLVDKLGKFKIGKACIYIKKLDDIDQGILQELMQQTIAYTSDRYERIRPAE